MQVEFLDCGKDPDPIDLLNPASGASSQESEFVRFRLSGVDNSFANGLRRVMLAEIPTLAITIVELAVNTSVLHDELMTHRIGLVPLKSPFHELVDKMPMPQECACGQESFDKGGMSYRLGCDACQIQCKFDAYCPPDENSVDFTSKHIVSDDPRFKLAVPENSEVFLAKLGRGQRIRGVAYAKKGIAKQHSRHMAVGTVSYNYDAEIALNHTGLSDLSEDHRRQWIERCPAKVFALVDGIVTTPHIEKCIMCRECLAQDAPFDQLTAPLVAVRNRRTANGGYSVVMRVESIGVMPAIDIVRVAVIILKRKMQAVQRGLEADKGGVATATDSAAVTQRQTQQGGGAGGGGDAAAGGVNQAAESSVVIGQGLMNSEQDLLHMAEKNPSMWG